MANIWILLRGTAENRLPSVIQLLLSAVVPNTIKELGQG